VRTMERVVPADVVIYLVHRGGKVSHAGCIRGGKTRRTLIGKVWGTLESGVRRRQTSRIKIHSLCNLKMDF